MGYVHRGGRVSRDWPERVGVHHGQGRYGRQDRLHRLGVGEGEGGRRVGWGWGVGGGGLIVLTANSPGLSRKRSLCC